MYAELYQYLINYKKLPVPGIGTFLLDRQPASIDFPNRLINAPFYGIILQSEVQPPARNFFSWLGMVLHISEREAVVKFNDFVYDLRQHVKDGDSIHWNGIGVLSRGLSGDVKFVPDTIEAESSVRAKKVIREKAAHMVRVGEDQKTSAEMEAMLNKPDEKRSYWWVAAAAIALLGVMFIGWYFSEHGVSLESTSNAMKLKPTESVELTKVLPRP
jgi:hypothetical protein